MEYVTCVVFGTLIALLFYYFTRKADSSFPPGPTGLPFFGYVPFLGSNAGERLMKLKEKYGNVMSISMVGDRWVVLNDYDAINEAYVKQADKFSGRKPTLNAEISGVGCGLIFSSHEPQWRKLRKFGQGAMRGFESRKRSLEADIAEEDSYLLDHLTSSNGDAFKRKLTMGVSNVVCRVVFGRRFEYDDKTFGHMVDYLGGFFSDRFESNILGLIAFAPPVRNLPFFREVSKRRMQQVFRQASTMKKQVKEHKLSYDENDVRDFIDAFLREMKYKKSESGEADGSTAEFDAVFSENNLYPYLRELFGAGTSTVASTLTWCLLALAHYPHIQEKLYHEIESVLGHSGIPCMKHESNLPYVCAFIHELMRHRTLGVIGGIPHRTTEDALLFGYKIPKGTTVVANLWAVHHDSKYFENPGEFRPERFIDCDGKFVKSNRVIPFSIGSRHCLGKHLARMEIFIFLASLIQKNRIVPNPKSPLPPFGKGKFNWLTYEAIPFDVIFENR